MRHLKIAAMTLWIFLACFWSAQGQVLPPEPFQPPPPLGEFPHYQPTIDSQRASGLAARGRFPEAVAAYLQIADSNPRTILGAESLFKASRLTETVEESNEILRRIANEYQGSRFAIFANFTLRGRELPEGLSFEDKTVALDAFVQSVGGPSVGSIIRAVDRTPLLAQFKSLPIETQLGLGGVYYEFFGGLKRPDRIDDAIRLAQFNQVALADAEWTLMHSFRNDLHWALLTKKGLKGIEPIPLEDPTVTPILPLANGIVGSRFTLEFKVQGGDYRHEFLDTAPRIRLDSREVGPPDAIRIENNLELEEDLPYETLYATLVLENIAPGRHEISVVAQIADYSGTGPGQATQTWSFTVSDTPPPLTTETLNSSKDSILSAQNPHRNEGANPLLQLSHRPEERNKANNPIVAFDLSSVDLSRVTKATLVMDIQECDLPKKWGSEGRNILAYPVNQSWVEGNGETIRVGQGEKTRGTGEGVTWFSPIDQNIANRTPNGSTQWMGARPFLGPLTAPAVRVVNRQTGQISFDVTQDVKSGFDDGWLIRKQNESAFGNVRFHSKEGGANLGPRLILEFGGQTAMSGPSKLTSALAEFFGFKTRSLSFHASPAAGEGPKGLGGLLRSNQQAAFVGEQVLLGFAGHFPLTQLGTRIVYRSWLRETLSLV